MKKLSPFAALLAAAALAGSGSPAGAWALDGDDDADRFGDPPEWPVWEPQPEPVAPPEGIYLVTETYVDDVVTRSAGVTTYATETAHEVTGSYARVLESVPTGGSSTFDGAAFNGRAALTDGRPVAGTYYENFVRTDGGYVSVSIVFFQDDQEARVGSPPAPVPVPAPVPPPPAPPVPPVPVGSPVPTPAQPAAIVITAPPATAAVAPVVERATPPIPQERELIAPPPSPTRVTPGPLPDRSIEVLRARRIVVTLDGPGVSGWQLISGECTVLGALNGSAAVPFISRWDRLAPRGSAWVARFRIEFADGTTRDLALRVTVRSPGLVE